MVVAATSELLVNFIDASIINAWLLHRRVYQDAQMDLLKYIKRVVISLMKE